jgi:tetratricopeptide (TPR) repeat protein
MHLAFAPRAEARDDDARTVYEEGARYYELGEYDRALERFERAYAISGAPALLVNIAQAYRRKGPESCDKAQAFYERFLEKVPATPRADEIRERIGEMRACVDQRRAARAVAAAPEPPPADRREPRDAPQPERSPADVPARRGPWRTAGWIGIGVGAAAAAVTIGAGAIALLRGAALEEACAADGGCPATERRSIATYDSARAVALVSGGVAAASLAVGAFAFWRAASAGARAPGVVMAVGPGAVVLRGAF